MNESIYYNVDVLHTAIAQNAKITFQYFQWDVHKKMVLRHDGALYEVSPWSLSWDDENYYLIAYDSREGKIKHFRVDKMLHIKIKNEKREGKSCFKEFDMAAYAKKTFGMFGGEEQTVKLLCDNSLAGVIIDRFGKDVRIVPVDEAQFEVNVRVAVSRQFFGWVIALGEGVRITEPECVVEQMREEIRRLERQYYKF
jgi:predicted DNA-binding transcriptional regulator YafY